MMNVFLTEGQNSFPGPLYRKYYNEGTSLLICYQTWYNYMIEHARVIYEAQSLA